MSGARRFAMPMLLAAVLVATIGCDRMTKRLASATLAGAPDRSFLAGTVRVAYAENTGGFLSVGAEWPAHGRIAVFVVITGALLAAMGVAIMRARWSRWPLLGATLFLAGGASNWIDRVVHGRVVDFLNLGIGPLRTGVFNVADVAILAGLGLLLWAQLIEEHRRQVE
jgi:signal peptidase II